MKPLNAIINIYHTIDILCAFSVTSKTSKDFEKHISLPLVAHIEAI